MELKLNSLGSVGDSAKAIARSYVYFTNTNNSGLPNDSTTKNTKILEQIFVFRQHFNKHHPIGGDLLQVINFVEFENTLLFEKIKTEDLAIFTFKIMFLESADWRKEIFNVSENTRTLILEIIHQTVLEIVPNTLNFTKKRFLESGLKTIQILKENPGYIDMLEQFSSKSDSNVDRLESSLIKKSNPLVEIIKSLFYSLTQIQKKALSFFVGWILLNIIFFLSASENEYRKDYFWPLDRYCNLKQDYGKMELFVYLIIPTLIFYFNYIFSKPKK